MQTDLEGPKDCPPPAEEEGKSAETPDAKTEKPVREIDVEEGWGGNPNDDDADTGGD